MILNPSEKHCCVSWWIALLCCIADGSALHVAYRSDLRIEIYRVSWSIKYYSVLLIVVHRVLWCNAGRAVLPTTVLCVLCNISCCSLLRIEVHEVLRCSAYGDALFYVLCGIADGLALRIVLYCRLFGNFVLCRIPYRGGLRIVLCCILCWCIALRLWLFHCPADYYE